MNDRRLGKTGLMVSEIGLGAEWLERHNEAEVKEIIDLCGGERNQYPGLLDAGAQGPHEYRKGDPGEKGIAGSSRGIWAPPGRKASMSAAGSCQLSKRRFRICWRDWRQTISTWA